jgi:glutamate/tyrosine decarboxylase-like PLP-dependent enzyme
MLEAFENTFDSSGCFVIGTSMANLIGVLIARTTYKGIQSLVAYTSPSSHISIVGFGSDALRMMPIDKI